MSMIEAEHQSQGVWLFTCHAHPKPRGMQAVSSPRDSISVMLDHCDKEHVGERMAIHRHSSPSGSKYNQYYTAKARK